MENYFIDIIGVAKWLVKFAVFGSPYFGINLYDVNWTDVFGAGKGWYWYGSGGQ